MVEVGRLAGRDAQVTASKGEKGAGGIMFDLCARLLRRQDAWAWQACLCPPGYPPAVPITLACPRPVAARAHDKPDVWKRAALAPSPPKTLGPPTSPAEASPHPPPPASHCFSPPQPPQPLLSAKSWLSAAAHCRPLLTPRPQESLVRLPVALTRRQTAASRSILARAAYVATERTVQATLACFTSCTSHLSTTPRAHQLDFSRLLPTKHTAHPQLALLSTIMLPLPPPSS